MGLGHLAVSPGTIVVMALDSPPDLLADGTPSDPGTDQPDGGSPPAWRRRRLLIVAAVVIVALAAASGWWFFLREDDTATAGVTMTSSAVEVTTGTFSESVSAEGTVAAAETEDLAFSSSGTVTAVDVAAGDTVVAGQVLATIDSAELEEGVAAAEADLADATAQLADDTDAGASDEQLDADEAAVTTAQDALDDAQDALDGASLVAGFDGLVASVDLTVGEQLGDSGTGGTTVTGSGSGSGASAGALGSSASSGPVPDVTGSTGADSSASSSTQIQVVSAGRYEVELAVDTADIDSVEVGQDVDLTISTDTAGAATIATPFGPGGGFSPPSGFPGATGSTGSGADSDSTDSSAADVTATGTVTEVSRVADASSGVATYAVMVTFTADSDEVWVGSAATAEIVTAERNDVVQVSSRAVSTSGGGSTVTVAVDGTADGATDERTVETGESSGDMVEIVSGLEPGEFVIVQTPSFGGGAGGMPGGRELPEGFEPPDGMQGPTGGQAPTGATQQEDGQ